MVELRTEGKLHFQKRKGMFKFKTEFPVLEIFFIRRGNTIFSLTRPKKVGGFAPGSLN